MNGLDQLTASGGTSLTHDGRGSLTGRGAWSYAHDVENNLTQVTGPVNLTLRYDALGRLERLIESGQDTRFVHDGAQVIGELDAATGAVRRRYVPGPGINEVIACYEGSGVGDRRSVRGWDIRKESPPHRIRGVDRKAQQKSRSARSE